MLRFQGFFVVFCVLAAMLFWAALSDGYGGYACCVEYSLEFLFGAAMVPGRSSQEDEAALFEWVEVESYEPEPPYTMIDNISHVFDLAGEAHRRSWCEHEIMYHIFEYGVPEGLCSMEAHMKALASV